MKKVVVGLSGGVDSSVAAYLLKKEGYEVIGVTMRTYDTEKSFSEREDARRVAEKLGIEYRVYDFREEFKKEVIDYFVEEYKHARTPNPCVVCNRKVKWEMLEHARKELNAEFVATGHYSSILRLAPLNHPEGKERMALKKAESDQKDQTYALYNLTQEQLAHTVFPLSGLTKPQVREIAKEAGLEVAEKKDSLDICFIPDGDYAKFIEGYEFGFSHKEEKALGKTEESGIRSWNKKGYFVNAEGKAIGWHNGIIHYTIGQRKGLNLPMGERVYVTAIHADQNEVVIGSNEDLFQDELVIEQPNWQAIAGISESEEFSCICKVRYKDKGTPCVITNTAGVIRVKFAEKVRAITPGQAAVFYLDNVIVGGGVIQ